MKLPTMLSVGIFFAILTLTSCSTQSLDDQTHEIELNLTNPEVKSIEVEILELINNHRLSMGLNTLSVMPVVKSVAYTHTDYMLDNEAVSHDNFFSRSDYLKSKVGAKKVSENVAYGYTTAQSVVNAWIKSDRHKENIEGDFSNFDISAKQNEASKWYYTNIFIKK